MTTFEGTFTALVTPFRDDAVDERALRDHVEWQIANGIDGLVPCGTTGESPVLREGEHARVIRAVVEQAKGRVPVIAGAGTASTHRTIALCKEARDAGADALLLVCPYYNKPTQEGLEAHFRAITSQVPLPSVLYNIPSRTGCDLAVETLERLGDIDCIVAVKEATGSVQRSQQIVARCGDRFQVLSGDDTLTIGILAVGGSGVVSVTSNLAPAEVTKVVRHWHDGAFDAARALHQRLIPLHEAMFVETNPGPVKAALALKKRIAPEIRLPLVWPSPQSCARITNAIETVGVSF